MSIYKLKPVFKDYIWSGHKLKEIFNKESNLDKVAESWELSTHPDGTCFIIDNGDEIKLTDFINEEGKGSLGENVKRFEDFPILIKLIDAQDSLSVQVHPDEEYAKLHENQHGKEEIWLVLDSDEDSFIYYGVNKPITKEEFKKAVENNTITDHLNKINVKKGDVFLIPPGTIHAIGKGCLIAEVQENSNVTYRIYDYDRRDDKGNPRELHLKQALDVANLNPIELNHNFNGHTGLTKSFIIDQFKVDKKPLIRNTDAKSFVFFLITEGKGTISDKDGNIKVKKGDSVFIPANSGEIKIKGDLELIEVRIPEKRI